MRGRVMLIVGAGGFLGSIARYLTASYFTKTFQTAFPYGTFVVNVAGCILIGVFYGLSEKHNWLTPEWRIFLTTGFCGGFTTFSSFTYENINLIQTAEYLTFSLYTVGSLVIGLLATYSGLLLTKI